MRQDGGCTFVQVSDGKKRRRRRQKGQSLAKAGGLRGRPVTPPPPFWQRCSVTGGLHQPRAASVVGWGQVESRAGRGKGLRTTIRCS